jgi:hypothetical protein
MDATELYFFANGPRDRSPAIGLLKDERKNPAACGIEPRSNMRLELG